MIESGIGRSVPRTEDARLVTGHGRFVDDIVLPAQCHAIFVRSLHAHARIRSVNVSAAAAMPGVLAVLTGAEAAADGLGPLPCAAPIANSDGTPIVEPDRPAMVVDRVRHVGDTVAMLVAETIHAAKAAAEAVEIEYEPLSAVTEVRKAVLADAPQVWSQAPGNLCFDWEAGDRAATKVSFASAEHVVSLDLVNNRVVPNPLETRAAIGAFSPYDGRYTLYTPTQGAHLIRGLAARVLNAPENSVRVVTPDVGGGFGMKMYLYPEQVLVLWAARRLGRPVRWVGERGEAFLTDSHGRDHVTRAQLALDPSGRFLAVRLSVLANLGAYLSTLGPFIPTVGGVRALTGPYDIPAAHVSVRGVFTHTVPVDAYRGAGRPEYVYVMERLAEEASRQLGEAPADLRNRNFVPVSAMPYSTALGQRYDSGHFARNLSDALLRADRDGFAERRAATARSGKLRGMGLCSYVEPCGGMRNQFAAIDIAKDGSLTLMVGAQASGQGHETAYAQLLAEHLGVPFDRIRVVEGDTDQVADGRGTSGSRSMPIGGPAVVLAAGRVIRKGRRIAAHMLESSEDDIEFASGQFVVRGTDRAMSFDAMVKAAYRPEMLSRDIEPGLHVAGQYYTTDTTFPNGTHVAEVVVDPETGQVEIVNYTAVDDFGVIINPMLVAGQVHGGVAQGIGQAVMENCVYDSSSGQLLSASFLDYGLPRACDLPMFQTSLNQVPCLTNVLGVKGCGEAGTIAAPAAVMNAVLDALAPVGVRALDMPATPDRVWRAIQAAQGEPGGT